MCSGSIFLGYYFAIGTWTPAKRAHLIDMHVFVKQRANNSDTGSCYQCGVLQLTLQDGRKEDFLIAAAAEPAAIPKNNASCAAENILKLPGDSGIKNRK